MCALLAVAREGGSEFCEGIAKEITAVVNKIADSFIYIYKIDVNLN
jgi:hypothetical protein